MGITTIEEKIVELLQDDPLYAVIRDTPLENVLYSDHYLTEIIEKKFYSTPEVAGWFEITDAQLRRRVRRQAGGAFYLHLPFSQRWKFLLLLSGFFYLCNYFRDIG